MAKRISRFLSELRRRKVYHVAVVYVAVGLGVAQGAEWLFSLMELPTVWARGAAVIVLLGFRQGVRGGVGLLQSGHAHVCVDLRRAQRSMTQELLEYT